MSKRSTAVNGCHKLDGKVCTRAVRGRGGGASFSGSSEEMTNPLMSQNSSSDNEKNVSLNGGSVELLDDGVSFYFTPSIGKQITMRCPDQSTAQKWVHSITVALSQDTWDSYVHGQARQEGGAGGGAARMRSPSAHAMVAAGSANNQAANTFRILLDRWGFCKCNAGRPNRRTFATGCCNGRKLPFRAVEHVLHQV